MTRTPHAAESGTKCEEAGTDGRKRAQFFAAPGSLAITFIAGLYGKNPKFAIDSTISEDRFEA